MFTKSGIRLAIAVQTSAVMLLMLSSCSATDSDVGSVWEDDVPIRFEVADENDEGVTRGAYETAKTMTTYSVYSFYNTRAYISNAVQTKTDGVWKSSRTITFPGRNALDFYALKPGFVRDDVQNLTMTGDEKSFVHTLPNENGKQTDFMFSSLLQKTKENTNNGALKFVFKHMFSYLRFASKCSVEGLNVKVRSITIHNIKSTGKFTFSSTKEKGGEWELDNAIDDYTFVLPEERELTAQNVIIHTTDSLLFVMSQTPSVFVLSDEGSFADADVEGSEKAYIEVECRLWKMKDDGNGGETPEYIGCTADTWAKVYFPMASTTKWQTASVPFSGTYNVMIDFSGGYDYDGQDFLEKHTSGSMRMTSLEPVQSFLVTDPWTDDDTNSLTIEMK